MSEIFERVLRPRRLPDEIASSILEAISRGDLQAGDRLPTEMDLSDQFGVARTVVREAISLLKFDGVISARQGVGAFVSETSSRRAFRISPSCFAKRQQLVKLLALRTSVQADAAAAMRRTDEQLAVMAAALQRFADAMGGGMDAAELRVDAEAAFYRTIAEASDNEYFVEFIQMIDAKLMENLRAVVVKNAMVSEIGDRVQAEHAARRLADRPDIGQI